MQPAKILSIYSIIICAISKLNQSFGAPQYDLIASDSSHHYLQADDEKYHVDHYASHGEKGDKGYKTNQHHRFKKRGEHGQEFHDGDYKDDGGKTQKHLDEADQYSKHHENAKGHKGAKFGEKKGHKKGHKTKGYHNKFYKDEYHREHRFYDNFHKDGHYSKFGDQYKNHENKHGGFKKGESHHSGYNDDHHGKKGHHDHGHYDDEHLSHKKKHGHESHQNRESNYSKHGDHDGGKSYGYKYKN